ncbi:MAG: FG-GAP-like repeat-containing protein, partial [Trichodesmium sp. St19_bin1]|nr:FG-GAP-like repeat-containing protein [Trichodesmium sp. St19_bin1]
MVDILSTSSKDDKIALYLKDGSNNFTEQTISTNADGATSVFAADVDGDGDVDVLSSSNNDDKIALYLNDGSNNFTEQTISTNADGANSVFAADVDGDGDVDVLRTSRNDDKIALYETVLEIADQAGNSFNTARELNIIVGNRSFYDFVSNIDTFDYYRFELIKDS